MIIMVVAGSHRQAHMDMMRCDESEAMILKCGHDDFRGDIKLVENLLNLFRRRIFLVWGCV